MAETVRQSAGKAAAGRQIDHWVNGAPHCVSGEPRAAVWNPATGEPAGEVALAGADTVAAALGAARDAYPAWRDTPPVHRARVMFRFKALIEAHADELAALITAEHGKVLSDAAGSLQRGLEVVEFACGIPHLLKGDFSRNVGSDIDCYMQREPVGVCVGVTPFNFPAMVPLWMFPLAIACGNTFILKPSEKTPSCALRMAGLMREAGLPAGVLNVINGGGDVAEALLNSPEVAAASFVGSTPVAEHVYRQAAKTGMRVQALGGAKNHLVVMPDADFEQTADALTGAAFGSAGERCMAVPVAVAVGDAGDRLREALLPRLRALRIGPGTDTDSDMGPLITGEHAGRVRGFIDAGEREGAELVVDGRDLKVTGYERGFFIGPTLFDHAASSMSICREEIFGPVLTILRAASLDQAIRLVNGHEFGNGASIFTRSGRAAREFQARAEAGMIGINVPIPVPAAYFSFGGRKRSLFGDSNVHGEEGVRFYTRPKTVTSRWPEGLPDGSGGLDMPAY